MTDANGTHDNLNGLNDSDAGEQSNQQLPSRPTVLGRIERPPLKAVGDKGGSKTILSPGRSSRRDSAAQRKRASGRAIKEGRRRTPAAKLPSASARKLANGVPPEKTRRRSRKSAPLSIPNAKTQGLTAKGGALVSTAPGRKPIPPNLSLARRRNVRRKTPVPLLYLGRLAIAGLGIAAIGGTFLKVLPSSGTRSADVTEVAAVSTATPASARFPITLGQEIAPLKSELQELPNLYPNLSAKAFYIDVDTGNYVDLEGGESIAAASTIKLPILLAFFEEVDQDRITFDQTLEITPEQIAEGSGEMQLSPPGTQFTALEVATQMIVTSDNTATNMMIDLLGGPAALNERFKGYGLQKTQLTSPLPDLTGTNTTSAKDLVHTMLLISSEDRLTTKSRDRILNILNRTHNKSLLADGMYEKEALTYNKTGDIESVLGDVALVDLSNGKRYIVAALVQRPSNDGRAVELIHRIAGRTYQDADEAVRPAVTPLGNPDAVENIGAEGATSTPTGVPVPDRVVEEEPYPSANP